MSSKNDGLGSGFDLFKKVIFFFFHGTLLRKKKIANCCRDSIQKHL